LLVEKGLRQQWQEKHTPPRTITETDYLLETSDLTRQGALCFKRAGAKSFESAGTEVPKLLTLPKLLAAANRLCVGREDNDADALAAVKTLLDAGTGSLGGARPKSAIADTDADGNETLHLAKFPHPADRWDVMRWEKISLDMAACAGIDVPESRLVRVSDANVLVLKRFDRTSTGERLGYMSAMTLLESDEGQERDYLDIADALTTISAAASQDLAELWRRLLFSLAINNTDDHLRNHAMLRTGKAWRLSPAFDLNPDPDLQSRRATAVHGATSFEDGWSAAHEVCQWYGLSEGDAAAIEAKIRDALCRWDEIALKHGATKAEMQLFAPVFERSKRVCL
jgi:serine/threonine-protein kinase HipA